MEHFRILLFLLLASLVSCSPQPDRSSDVIHINPDELVNPVQSGEDWIESLAFVALETKGDNFCPEHGRIKYRRGFWLVGNFDYLLIFSQEGKLISRISAKGKGPEEYHWISDFDLLPDQDQIVIADNKKMTFFSLDGTFIEKQPLPHQPVNIVALGNDLFAFAPGRLPSSRADSLGNYQFLMTNRQGEIILRKFEFPYRILNDMDVEFIRSTDQGSWLFCLSYDTRIFQAGPGPQVRVRYDFDFEHLNPDTSFLQKEIVVNNYNLYEFNPGKVVKVFGVAETPEYLIIRCGSDKHQKVAWRIISRRTGHQRTVSMDEPPKLGYFKGWPILPYLSTVGDFLMSQVAAVDVVEFFDRLTPAQKEELAKYSGFSSLASLKPEDNPVVVLYKLKAD
ncbi:MAG: 6-bladed beta-propeller [Bacteroidales bacterium]